MVDPAAEPASSAVSVPPIEPPVTARAFSALTPLLALVWLATGAGMLAYLLISKYSVLTSVLVAAGTLLYVRGLFNPAQTTVKS
jgi:hypothetical protein